MVIYYPLISGLLPFETEISNLVLVQHGSCIYSSIADHVPGFLDQKGGRSCHLFFLRNRWYFLTPFVSYESGTGSQFTTTISEILNILLAFLE
jgi:hypothetical protein